MVCESARYYIIERINFVVKILWRKNLTSNKILIKHIIFKLNGLSQVDKLNEEREGTPNHEHSFDMIILEIYRKRTLLFELK